MSEIAKAGRQLRLSKKCLTPLCENLFGDTTLKHGRGARGLCKRCHLSASSLVRRKLTTWQELEKHGLAEPKYGSLVELGLRQARALIESKDLTDFS